MPLTNISPEKDWEIILDALEYSLPPPIECIKFMMKDNNWREPYSLAVGLFKQTTPYKKNSRKYTIKLNSIKFKFLRDFLDTDIHKKKIIRNNIIITGIRKFWLNQPKETKEEEYDRIFKELDSLLWKPKDTTVVPKDATANAVPKCNCRNEGFGFCFCRQ